MATTTESRMTVKQDASSSTISFDDITAQLRPRIKEWKNSWDLIRHNWTAMLGLILIIIMIIIALMAPVLAPAKGIDSMYIPRDFGLPKPPFIEGHPLGTGEMGADIYYGTVWGARTTIVISLYVVLTAALVGLVIGAISGYYGGVIDELLMRFTDIFLSLPALIMAMAIASILTRSLDNMMFALILVWWPSYARLIRGQVLTIRESTYVEAAKAIGANRSRILFRHIVPNSLSPLIVSITLDLGAVALTAASLSYIGFGVPSGYAEWGRMVSDGQGWFLSTVPYMGVNYNPWWVVTFPALMILMFTMGFSLLGDGLRDILDPRSRR